MREGFGSKFAIRTVRLRLLSASWNAFKSEAFAIRSALRQGGSGEPFALRSARAFLFASVPASLPASGQAGLAGQARRAGFRGKIGFLRVFEQRGTVGLLGIIGFIQAGAQARGSWDGIGDSQKQSVFKLLEKRDGSPDCFVVIHSASSGALMKSQGLLTH
jgi:hypothetical protein